MGLPAQRVPHTQDGDEDDDGDYDEEDEEAGTQGGRQTGGEFQFWFGQLRNERVSSIGSPVFVQETTKHGHVSILQGMGIQPLDWPDRDLSLTVTSGVSSEICFTSAHQLDRQDVLR